MKKKITYPNRIFRLTISALAVFYILFHGRSWNILEEVRTVIFYVAFSISFIVALLMVKWVHYITISLDKWYSWSSVPALRSFWQLTLGVIVPLLIDFVMMSIYFYVLGSNIFENGFIKHDFPVIVCLIFLLNAYYIGSYLYAIVKTSQENYIETEKLDYDMVYFVDHRVSEEVDYSEPIIDKGKLNVMPPEEDVDPDDEDILTIEHNGTLANFKITDEILYFYRHNRKTYAVSTDRNEYAFSISFPELKEKYAHVRLCKINRTVIVNCNLIRGYTSDSKKGTFMVLFKDQLGKNLSKGRECHFNISREYFENFKMYFKKI